MQNLKELILLLNQHNIHPLKHLAGSEESKLLALYEDVFKGKHHADEEAAAALYGGKGGVSGNHKLTSDLRERLLEHVFQINTDQSHYSDYQKAYYDCHKQWVVVRFLTGQNGPAGVEGLGFELYQNAPNPWTHRTQIGFYLPRASEATLTVYDETGRILYGETGDFAKGYNAFTLDRALLETTGMLYYKVETPADSAVKKMIQTK